MYYVYASIRNELSIGALEEGKIRQGTDSESTSLPQFHTCIVHTPDIQYRYVHNKHGVEWFSRALSTQPQPSYTNLVGRKGTPSCGWMDRP